jgi:hypothetical protein
MEISHPGKYTEPSHCPISTISVKRNMSWSEYYLKIQEPEPESSTMSHSINLGGIRNSNQWKNRHNQPPNK